MCGPPYPGYMPPIPLGRMLTSLINSPHPLRMDSFIPYHKPQLFFVAKSVRREVFFATFCRHNGSLFAMHSPWRGG